MSPLCWSSGGRSCVDIVRVLASYASGYADSTSAQDVLQTWRRVVSQSGKPLRLTLRISMKRFDRSNEPAPQIAIDYWRLRPDAKLLDVLYAVRSDETTHRFVNHSLANLNPSTDVNPFALREPDMHIKGKKIAYVYFLPCNY
jgi:Alternative oxidase